MIKTFSHQPLSINKILFCFLEEYQDNVIFKKIKSLFVANVVNILSECYFKYIHFKWLSLKRQTFWVTVPKNTYILRDCHSKDIHFEWVSLKRHTFWVTVTQKTYSLGDCHLKDTHFEWLSLKRHIFWVTVTQNMSTSDMLNIKIKNKNKYISKSWLVLLTEATIKTRFYWSS